MFGLRRGGRVVQTVVVCFRTTLCIRMSFGGARRNTDSPSPISPIATSRDSPPLSSSSLMTASNACLYSSVPSL